MYLRLFLLLCMCLHVKLEAHRLVIDFQKKMKTMPEERLYLQTSKDIYETGEDLWFKAYQLNTQSFSLSDKSKTLYLEMAGLNDSVVWQEKYPVRYGITAGHVYVDERLPEGEYRLRGYTKCSFYMNDTVTPIASKKNQDSQKYRPYVCNYCCKRFCLPFLNLSGRWSSRFRIAFQTGIQGYGWYRGSHGNKR